MFVKIYPQIFDSSIAKKYELRHFFEDMLKLADSDGVVDMTPDAISRRINLPLEKVIPLLKELGEPDPDSRTPDSEGRRILPLDSHRTWGWIITNYGHYRKLRNEEERRLYNRDAKRKERGGLKRHKKLPGEATYDFIDRTQGREAADRWQERQQMMGVNNVKKEAVQVSGQTPLGGSAADGADVQNQG